MEQAAGTTRGLQSKCSFIQRGTGSDGVGALQGAGPLIVSFGISLLVIFYIIHSPHRPLHILYSLEALVETEVVADSVLPAGSVASEVAEGGRKPSINVVESELLVGSLENSLSN